jgi:hypothetical protein
MPAGTWLLIGQGSGGGSSPPATPTLAIAGATATVSGSTSGSTNTIDVAPLGLGSSAWTSAGSRTSDGTVDLSALSPGAYDAVCQSVLAGLPALVSNKVGFTISNGGTRTVVPLGNLPVGHAGVAWLVASSANFQALVGAASASAALAHVSFEADDTEESGSSRPRAIVVSAEFEEKRVALNEFRPFMRFVASIEAYPPAGIEAETPREIRLWDEQQWFENLCQAILDDCKATEGIGTGYKPGITQVSCSSIRLEGMGPVEDVRAEGELGETASYFYGAQFTFEIHG